jgi:hypothetical protein
MRAWLAVLGVCVTAACGSPPAAGGPGIPLAAQVSGTIPPAPSPLPTVTGTTTTTASEGDAWAQIRARLPRGTPVAAPTWLPAALDRERVVIGDVGADPKDPRYVVTYSGGGRAVELGMGAGGPPDGGSGLGTRVRRSAATLTFPTSLYADPLTPATRVVKWQEAGRVLWISSSTFSGGDLLRIAWELDLGSAPAARYRRVKDGVCASTSTPEDTIDKLMSLVGSGDADAVLDCFALDVGFANWATEPTTTDRTRRALGEVGGRVYVQAAWTFTSAPAFWTQGSKASQFFQLGLEGGRWRVFEVGSAAYGSPP